MNTDPIKLELYKNMLTSVAEEMGVTLQRTAFSPNIKERLDFSCAVFDNTGKMVAQAAHIPVHLGSMPLSVLAAIDAMEMMPGDMIALNDPYRGGTHLPDITLVAPVFSDANIVEEASDERTAREIKKPVFLCRESRASRRCGRDDPRFHANCDECHSRRHPNSTH